MYTLKLQTFLEAFGMKINQFLWGPDENKWLEREKEITVTLMIISVSRLRIIISFFFKDLSQSLFHLTFKIGVKMSYIINVQELICLEII